MRPDTVAKQLSCKAYRATIGLKGKYIEYKIGNFTYSMHLYILLSVTKYYYLIDHDTIDTHKKVIRHVKIHL